MTQHARRRDALLAFLLAGGFCPSAWGQDNPLVQRGVPAEATAENAVLARERAFAAARRIAWQRLQAATGASGTPSDAQLESMVSAIIVEEERTTPTRYVGRLTVQFASGTAGLTRPQASPGGGAWGGGGGLNIPAPPQARVEAEARFVGMQEWLELRRRLLSAEAVAGMEVSALAVDGARLRLSLRQQPPEAREAVGRAGVWVDDSGPLWRIGLGGGR